MPEFHIEITDTECKRCDANSIMCAIVKGSEKKYFCFNCDLTAEMLRD